VSDSPSARTLALLRAEIAPPPEAQARVLSTLAKSIPGLGHGGGGGDSGGAGGGAGQGAVGMGGAKMLASFVAVFVIGGGVGAAIYASAPRALVAHPSVDRIVVLAPAQMPTAASAAVIANPAAGSNPSALELPVARPVASAALPVVPVASAWATSSTKAPARSAQLDEERALLDVARTALVRDDATAALASLGEHAHRFAKPLLAEEREALAVQALVKVGRVDEARARGAEFERRWPASISGGAVRAALASIP
jgi:hypothetical protein